MDESVLTQNGIPDGILSKPEKEKALKNQGLIILFWQLWESNNIPRPA
ncbi:hypothetical protein [Undibacterium sp. WLX3042]